MIDDDDNVPNETKRRSLAISEDGVFDIRNYIPYLINRAAIVLIEQFEAGLDESALARTEWRVLAILSQRGPTRFGALAKLAALEPPTLSRVVASLSKRGLVVKNKSNIDARGIVIEPTTEALDQVQQIVPHALRVEGVAISGMSNDEARFLMSLLQRMCENLSPWVPDDEAQD
ncbi:winged helix-turn-helix transcriptional regulator (plasmid) [Rhizobium bangladeshense]|uniref:MarR family winged helix-turn-helix transcriptional regulator n=1 Tax=Rhizobium bangladeshense TaxID=1138189 RepID=UPI001A98670B|nr:MarR family winged helix-turn-helix transcriptional regulator [Rhizobium bangladeshense]QSY97868.1 winged helix-turn-helix transcriptional regulator [Rhizobium bangladeshense]